MNICIMMGRPTKDPEIHYTQDGKAIARFTLAVDRRFKRDGQPDADFHTCVCFGKTAEFIEKYIQKGTKVIVTGSLQDNNYQGKDGQTVYAKQIVCDNVEFAESKAASQRNNQSAPAAPEQKPDKDGFINIPDGIDEELPFA